MIKLNLGCGWRNFGPGWIHIDGGDYPHLDSKDIINLPYEDNSVDIIYASHVLEYFDRDEAKNLLTKWHTKLKPGGIIRLAVPDFEAMAKLYVEQNYSLSSFLGPLYGKMPMGEYTIYHKTTYDYLSLEKLLSDITFTYIKKYNWQTTEHAQFDDHSQAYIPHMDKENGTLISLNIEAIK
jgi:ubiquinone/menaquinone biosynthesis C-methylase UbiE